MCVCNVSTSAEYLLVATQRVQELQPLASSTKLCPGTKTSTLREVFLLLNQGQRLLSTAGISEQVNEIFQPWLRPCGIALVRQPYA